MDDLHPKWNEKERLKNWADKFPFQAEFKGGSMLIRPARIVVTSNYTPQQVRTVNHFQFHSLMNLFLALSNRISKHQALVFLTICLIIYCNCQVFSELDLDPILRRFRIVSSSELPQLQHHLSTQEFEQRFFLP